MNDFHPNESRVMKTGRNGGWLVMTTVSRRGRRNVEEAVACQPSSGSRALLHASNWQMSCGRSTHFV